MIKKRNLSFESTIESLVSCLGTIIKSLSKHLAQPSHTHCGFWIISFYFILWNMTTCVHFEVYTSFFVHFVRQARNTPGLVLTLICLFVLLAWGSKNFLLEALPSPPKAKKKKLFYFIFLPSYYFLCLCRAVTLWVSVCVWCDVKLLLMCSLI